MTTTYNWHEATSPPRGLVDVHGDNRIFIFGEDYWVLHACHLSGGREVELYVVSGEVVGDTPIEDFEEDGEDLWRIRFHVDSGEIAIEEAREEEEE